MTDPPDVEQEVLREFIDAEKTCPEPPAEVGQRVFARLAASLGLPPGLPDGPTPSAPPGGPLHTGLLRRTVAGISRRGVATFLVGAAVGAASYGTIQHVRERPAVPVGILASPAEPPRTMPPPAPEPVVAAPRPGPTTATSRAREVQPGRDARDRGLGAERKLVEMARSALARGQTDRALLALRSHARSFPNGQLAEERDSLMVQALVAKGDFAQARQRAARFHRQHPGSLFAPVVDEALGSIP